MKRLHYYSIGLLFALLISTTVYSQNKEYQRLKDLVSKGKMNKAQEYCNKVTASLSAKNAAKFFGLLGKAYYNRKNYVNAAELILKSKDSRLSLKLAKEFDDKDSEVYDKKVAIELYKKAKEYVRAAELLFEEGKYKEAAEICPSAASNIKYGDSLFDNGKVDEALHFYKRAKIKGQKFDSKKVLDYYYQKKAYAVVYTIQNYKEGDFKMHIQGSVIDKMFENNEPMAFINNFMDSIGVATNKKDEVVIEALVNNKMFDKAEAYCMKLKEPYQQIALTFLAGKTSKSQPNVSAWANLKIGRSYIALDLLTTYMIETAKSNNDKWSKEPIDKKLLKAFYNKTKPSVEKCKQEYCKFVLHVVKKCAIKLNNYIKDKPKQTEEYTRAAAFLQQVKLIYCN